MTTHSSTLFCRAVLLSLCLLCQIRIAVQTNTDGTTVATSVGTVPQSTANPSNLSTTVSSPTTSKTSTTQTTERTQPSTGTNPDAVTNLIVSIKTISSVYLTWNYTDGSGCKFRVNWTNGNENNSNHTSNTYYNVTGLTAGVNYTFTVTAVSADKQTRGPEIQTSTFTKPNSVNNLTVVNVTTSSILLNWTEAMGEISHYEIQYENSDTIISETAELSTINITNLTPGVQYTFKVFAVSADNETEGIYSNISAYTKPDVVKDLNVIEITTSSLFVNWTEPRGEKSFFNVQWSNDIITQNSTTTNNSYNITNLSPGENYTLLISAVAADNRTEGEPVAVSVFTKPDSVKNLTVVNVTTLSILLNWTEAMGEISHYKIQYQNSSTIISETAEHMINITNLTPGVQYTFKVFAVAADNKTEGICSNISAYTNPDVVTNLTVSNKTTSSVYLTWNNPNGSWSHFIVNWTDGSESNSNSTSAASYNITDLTAGVRYTFTVTAVAGDKQTTGAETQISTFTKPEAVTNLTVSSSTSTVYLTWAPPPGNQFSFIVYWTDGSENKSSDTSAAFYNITGLTAGVNYTFTVTVVARDNQTTGPETQIATFTIAGDNHTRGAETQTSTFTKPNAVTNLTVSNKTSSSVHLTWNNPIGKWSNFIIQWSDSSENNNSHTSTSIVYQTWNTSDGNWPHSIIDETGDSENNTTALSGTSYTVTGLTAGVNYIFTVTAVAGDNKTKGAETRTSTFSNPNVVTNLTVCNKTTSSVYLTWNNPNGSWSHFIVNWTDGSESNSNSTSAASYNITDLTAGVRYTFTVTAVAGDNQTKGAETQTSTFTKPNIVTSVIISNKTTSSVYLTWAEPDGNWSYFLITWTDVSENNINITSSLSYTVTGLNAGMNYTFTVIAAAEDKTIGAATQKSTFTKPNAATNLTVSNKTTSSVHLTWNEPEGNWSYFIVKWTDGSENNNSSTSNSSYTVNDLDPGVNYTFTVIAVAADGETEGAPTQNFTFTKPDIIRNLTSPRVTSTSVFLDWAEPLGSHSFFRVHWANGNMTKTPATDSNITDLIPGTNYLFSVSAVAADNKTEGSLVWLSTCTVASPASDITCEGPNRTSPPLLTLTWTNPPGNNQGFHISLKQSLSELIPTCNVSCSHTFSTNLKYFSPYTVIILTHGCGQSGTQEINCRTGITEPPVPRKPEEVKINATAINEHAVQLMFNTSLLNSTNGPIEAYGVVLSTDHESNISTESLRMNYSDWKHEKTKTYLTVLKFNENIKRSSMITVVIGNGSTGINNTAYENRPLSNEKYSVALVLFTYLNITDRLINIEESIFSVTHYSTTKAKPLDPESNTVAIVLGVVLPVICFIILMMLRRLRTRRGHDRDEAVTERSLEG